MLRTSIPFLAALSMLSTGNAGEEPAAKDDTDISKVKLGEHWYGPDLKVEDLKGRVVLLEFWGFK